MYSNVIYVNLLINCQLKMKIIEVKNNTLGKSIGLKPGDRLLKINGKKVVDEIDYRFSYY